MAITGPSFISLQVRDLERAAAFYEGVLGLTRQPGPPHAVVFATQPIALAVRDLEPGVDLDAGQRPGVGVAIWMHTSDLDASLAAVTAAGTPIVVEPYEGPFGRTFAFTDPDGYQVTLHDRV